MTRWVDGWVILLICWHLTSYLNRLSRLQGYFLLTNSHVGLHLCHNKKTTKYLQLLMCKSKSEYVFFLYLVHLFQHWCRIDLFLKNKSFGQLRLCIDNDGSVIDVHCSYYSKWPLRSIRFHVFRTAAEARLIKVCKLLLIYHHVAILLF